VADLSTAASEQRSGSVRPHGMTPRGARLVFGFITVVVLSAFLAGCSSAATTGASASPGASRMRLTEPTAKEALLVRFGPLVYCDPDSFPVAKGDDAGLAAEHLATMRGDTVTWAAIADHLGVSPSATLDASQLLAAYRDWKMLQALTLTAVGDDWGFDAQFSGAGPDASVTRADLHIVGTITTDGVIHVDTQEPAAPLRCPICLARGALIATPAGDIAVESLRQGNPVWTLAADGSRMPAVVVAVGSTPVPSGHEVVRLVLADGRSVLVSPGHPMPDGRPVGVLHAGDAYDGSVVRSTDRIRYDGGRTYDLLPSGATGVYWANGIELGSTLAR